MGKTLNYTKRGLDKRLQPSLDQQNFGLLPITQSKKARTVLNEEMHVFKILNFGGRNLICSQVKKSSSNQRNKTKLSYNKN